MGNQVCKVPPAPDAVLNDNEKSRRLQRKDDDRTHETRILCSSHKNSPSSKYKLGDCTDRPPTFFFLLVYIIMDKLLAWRNFMIGIFLWITTWEVWRAFIQSFAFGKKHYVAICFTILVILTIYMFNNSTIGWNDL